MKEKTEVTLSAAKALLKHKKEKEEKKNLPSLKP
jgi:hypothetical protein